MSDRYGYGDGRSSRSDDSRGRYGDRDSARRDAGRSLSGTGAYSGRTLNRRTVSYNSEDDSNWPQLGERSSSYSSSRRSQSGSRGYSSRRGSDSGYGSRSTGRSSASGRSDGRDARRSGAGSATRSAARRSSDDVDYRTSRRQATADASHSTRSTRRTAYDSSSQTATRHATGSATGRYSRSSYGSEDSRSSSASRQRSSMHDRQSARSSRAGGSSSNGSAGGGAAALSAQPSRRRPAVIVAIVLVALLLVGAIAAFAYVRSITGSLHEGVDQDLRAALVETDMANEPFYMLLLGTDQIWWRDGTDEGGVYRSDTMILARVDVPNGTITLVSIPRDTLVYLGDEYGWQKINIAYGLGGPSLAVEAVSSLTGVEISHYAEVNMDGLAAVVDAIGGIEVEVPVEIDDADAGGYVAAGWQTLNGEQALIVCRSRNAYVDTSAAPDLMRAANQRMVLSAIAHKVLASDVATIAKTVSSVSEYVMTDLELNDIVGLAQALQGMDTDDAFYTASLPTHAVYVVNGYGYPTTDSVEPTDTVDPSIPEAWYGLLDEDDWNVMKGRMSEGLPPADGLEIDEATGTVLSTAGSDADDISGKYAWITVMNGTDREGLATRAMGILNANGFDNVTLEDAPYGNEYPETLIIYNEAGRSHEAEQIADALGQGRTMVNDGNWVVENDFLIIIGDDWKGTATSSSSSSESASSSSSSA